MSPAAGFLFCSVLFVVCCATKKKKKKKKREKVKSRKEKKGRSFSTNILFCVTRYAEPYDRPVFGLSHRAFDSIA